MSTRMYGDVDVTAFSFDTADALNELGSGTLKIEAASVENSALKDAWTANHSGRKTVTFTGEFACDTLEGVHWWAKVGTTAAMVFTDTVGSISGQFTVESAEKSINDAMKWNVSLKNDGEVTGI